MQDGTLLSFSGQKRKQVVDVSVQNTSLLEKTTREGGGGSDDMLKEFKIVLGGDALTRIRLNEAKALRGLSTNRKRRFDDLSPIVLELWHVKQDLLEKLYKSLYNPLALRTEGSLSFFKAKLLRTDITGKVKGHFKSHMEFFLLIGEEVIVEQGRQFLQDIDGLEINDDDDKLAIINELLDEFMNRYGYVPPIFEKPIVHSVKDEMFNYFNNLAQWYLHIQSMNKAAKDGDVTSIVPNLMMCLPLFYHHSPLSKYLVECMNYILQVEYLLSPLMKLRVLEGSFVNVRGGKSNNIESDLLQEHAVRNQKTLIKQLGANKTEKAIERASGAAEAISAINNNMEKSLGLKPKSSKHTKAISPEDKEPFCFSPGRKFSGYEHLSRTVFSSINGGIMNMDFNRILNRLLAGFMRFDHDQEPENTDEESDADDNLPDL